MSRVPKTFTVTLETYHLMALLEAATSEHLQRTAWRGQLLVEQLQQDADFAWPIVEQLAEQGFTCLQDGDGVITDIKSSDSTTLGLRL